jgi:hypothetical protein
LQAQFDERVARCLEAALDLLSMLLRNSEQNVSSMRAGKKQWTNALILLRGKVPQVLHRPFHPSGSGEARCLTRKDSDESPAQRHRPWSKTLDLRIEFERRCRAVKRSGAMIGPMGSLPDGRRVSSSEGRSRSGYGCRGVDTSIV